MLTALPATGAMLVIEDRGPGFPDGPEALRRGTSGQGSTGLGLDIARSTAEASGGQLRIARGLRGGGCVQLELGGATGAVNPDPPPRFPGREGQPAAVQRP
jgi:signal transduction histidine kinase